LDRHGTFELIALQSELGRLDNAQRPISACAVNYLDFPPTDNFAANEAIMFLNLSARLKEQASRIQKVSAQLEASKPAPQMAINDQ
jgi:hypothetical protein